MSQNSKNLDIDPNDLEINNRECFGHKYSNENIVRMHENAIYWQKMAMNPKCWEILKKMRMFLHFMVRDKTELHISEYITTFN